MDSLGEVVYMNSNMNFDFIDDQWDEQNTGRCYFYRICKIVVITFSYHSLVLNEFLRAQLTISLCFPQISQRQQQYVSPIN